MKNRRKIIKNMLSICHCPYVLSSYNRNLPLCHITIKHNVKLQFLGWNDIGYNFLVGEDGNAYEGRGWNNVGAHANPYNSESYGISVIGTFTSSVPNAGAQSAVQALIACGVSNVSIYIRYSKPCNTDFAFKHNIILL